LANHVAERWSDAVIRAIRTFYTSVGIDILLAIGAGLTLLLNGGDPMTPAFWIAVLGLVVRSTVTGIATYFVRLKLPPKNSQPTL
jgi:hypothetical protein